jgi:hypothetical protein
LVGDSLQSTGAGTNVPMEPLPTSGLGADLGGEVTGGLVRRALSRAATTWASENNLDILNAQGRIIAPEVTYLEFRYFDGFEWLEQWDTEQEGGLPTAVEIAIAVRRPGETAEESGRRRTSALRNPRDADPESAIDLIGVSGTVYRLVVDVPAGEPTADEDEQDLGTAEEVVP